MKRTLNIKLKSKTIVNVGKFSSEEDTKSKRNGGNTFSSLRKY